MRKSLQKIQDKYGVKVRKKDKKQYVLSTNVDLEILGKIYKLEGKKLLGEDKHIVKLIRSQLRHDWRTPLIKELNRLFEEYR